MRISQLAAQVGVAASAIRYYERIGLLPAPIRVNGRRTYEDQVLDRLTVIRFGIHVGFSLQELRLPFTGFDSPSAKRALVQARVQELNAVRQRAELMARILKSIRLCRCGTLRQCAERLIKAGALPGASERKRRRARKLQVPHICGAQRS